MTKTTSTVHRLHVGVHHCEGSASSERAVPARRWRASGLLVLPLDGEAPAPRCDRGRERTTLFDLESHCATDRDLSALKPLKHFDRTVLLGLGRQDSHFVPDTMAAGCMAGGSGRQTRPAVSLVSSFGASQTEVPRVAEKMNMDDAFADFMDEIGDDVL